MVMVVRSAGYTLTLNSTINCVPVLQHHSKADSSSKMQRSVPYVCLFLQSIAVSRINLFLITFECISVQLKLSLIWLSAIYVEINAVECMQAQSSGKHILYCIFCQASGD